MLAINPIHVDEALHIFLTNSLNLISWQAGNYLKPLQYKLFTRGRLKLHKNNVQHNIYYLPRFLSLACISFDHIACMKIKQIRFSCKRGRRFACMSSAKIQSHVNTILPYRWR